MPPGRGIKVVMRSETTLSDSDAQAAISAVRTS